MEGEKLFGYIQDALYGNLTLLLLGRDSSSGDLIFSNPIVSVCLLLRHLASMVGPQTNGSDDV